MGLFPYNPRKNQIAIMQTIKRTLSDKKDLIFESGTGSGKTVCTLTAALEFAIEYNKKIVYTTRTNAQQRQVILELRAIKQKNPDFCKDVFAVGMQGRSNMCLFAQNNPDFEKGNSEELSRFCSNEKKKVKSSSGSDKGCFFYRNFLDKKRTEKIVDWAKENIPSAEEFISFCRDKQSCPYECNKMLMRDAKVVVVPYIYVFDLMIRNMLLDYIGVAEEDIVLIVDEAHNLPDYIRDLYSANLSLFMLNNCISESDRYGNPVILGGKNTVSGFCEMLVDIVNVLRDTYVYGILENGIRTNSPKNNDAFIPSSEFRTEIMSRLGVTSKTLHDIIGDLIAYGEKIQEYRQKDGKLPRSYLHKLGLFLDFWMSCDMDQYAKLVVDTNAGKNPRIEAYCLDPSIGTEIIRYFHSSIHMSGTLEPLEEYRDSMGLSEKTELICFPSPFTTNNRRVLFVNDVTTKYDEILRDEKITSRMTGHITNICNSFPRNTMVFFPSFNVMNMFKRNGEFSNINRCVFFEEQAMSQAALMNIVSDFKEYGNNDSDGAALFSVMGGRISEGMDFPAEELEIAIIVGIPYPKPSARQRGLQHYYDIKFRKGWEYTVEAPTARKLLQSIGRLIRNENDRGVAVILDNRAVRFKKYLKDLKESKDLEKDIHSFLKSKKI